MYPSLEDTITKYYNTRTARTGKVPVEVCVKALIDNPNTVFLYSPKDDIVLMGVRDWDHKTVDVHIYTGCTNPFTICRAVREFVEHFEDGVLRFETRGPNPFFWRLADRLGWVLEGRHNSFLTDNGFVEERTYSLILDEV